MDRATTGHLDERFVVARYDRCSERKCLCNRKTEPFLDGRSENDRRVLVVPTQLLVPNSVCPHRVPPLCELFEPVARLGASPPVGAYRDKLQPICGGGYPVPDVDEKGNVLPRRKVANSVDERSERS